jgi:hypothetical protein
MWTSEFAATDLGCNRHLRTAGAATDVAFRAFVRNRARLTAHFAQQALLHRRIAIARFSASAIEWSAGARGPLGGANAAVTKGTARADVRTRLADGRNRRAFLHAVAVESIARVTSGRAWVEGIDAAALRDRARLGASIAESAVRGRLLRSAHVRGTVAGRPAMATGTAVCVLHARLARLEPAYEDVATTLDGLSGGATASERRGVDVDARASSCSVVDQVGVIPVPIDVWPHPVLDLGVAIGKIVQKSRLFTARADVVAQRARESAREVIGGDRRRFVATACSAEREGCAERESQSRGRAVTPRRRRRRWRDRAGSHPDRLQRPTRLQHGDELTVLKSLQRRAIGPGATWTRADSFLHMLLRIRAGKVQLRDIVYEMSRLESGGPIRHFGR